MANTSAAGDDCLPKSRPAMTGYAEWELTPMRSLDALSSGRSAGVYRGLPTVDPFAAPSYLWRTPFSAMIVLSSRSVSLVRQF